MKERKLGQVDTRNCPEVPMGGELSKTWRIYIPVTRLLGKDFIEKKGSRKPRK